MSKEKEKVLILAALPDRLRLDKEIREIEEAIKRAVKRDSFEIKIRTAVRTQDIRRALAEEKPQIVHFCGHGIEDGSLVLEDDGGNHLPVSPIALAALFKLHTEYIKCVLLNACYSALLAEAISKHINYVIGMNQPIEDRAAIVFAQGFYDGLGYDNTDSQDVIQRAFDEGVVAIQMEKLSQDSIPVFKRNLNKQKINPTEIAVLKNDAYRATHLDKNFDLAEQIWIQVLTTTQGRDMESIKALQKIAIARMEQQRPSGQVILNEDDLSSEVDIDYSPLQALLKAQRWGEADLATLGMMLMAANCEESGWDEESIRRFPCTDLQTIDRLWVKYSNGRFGFSVQKTIYLTCGGKPDYRHDERVWEKFGNYIGWKNKKSWLYYSDLTFSNEAPIGHFPVLPYFTFWYVLESGDEAIGWVPTHIALLVQKLVRCNI
jgi:hypothetical protein